MKIILKIFIITILFAQNSFSQQVVNEVNSIFECESLTGISGLKTGVNRFEGRDGANLKSGAFIPTCSTKSVVLKANPFLIPLITTPSGVGSPANDYYSTSAGTDETYDLVAKAADHPLVALIPGSASVSPTGAASYQIPINLPAGPNGVTPQFALTYNSQGGNGLAGWGWDLSGLSVVSRVPDDFYYDGKFSHLQLDNTDNLALDGNRLIYDAASGKYHTEIDPYNAITVQSDLTTPFNIAQYITVTNKSGTTMIYGKTNSQVNLSSPPAGKNVPIAWLLDQIKDKHGNVIDYKYSKSGGDTYLQEVDYASNVNTGAAYKVFFKYTQGPDDNKYFVLGTSYIQKKLLLKSILIECNSKFIKEYTLDYAYDGQVSKLIKIALTQGVSKINETIVSWQGNLATIIPAPLANAFPNIKNFASGDLNGDGMNDLVVLYGTLNPGGDLGDFFYPTNMDVLLGQEAGGFATILSSSIFTNDVGLPADYPRRVIMRVWIADGDNDGKAEIYTIENFMRTSDNLIFSGDPYLRYIQKKLVKSGSTYSLSNVELKKDQGDINHYAPVDNRVKPFIAGDFDGETNSDLLYLRVWWDYNENDNSDCYSAHTQRLMCDDDYVQPFVSVSKTLTESNYNLPKNNTFISADFDGDGKSELLTMQIKNLFYPDKSITSSSLLKWNSSGNFTAIPFDLSAINNNRMIFPIMGDFNGDGLVDLLTYNIAPYVVTVSGGGKGGHGGTTKVTKYDQAKSYIYLNTLGGFALNNTLVNSLLTILPQKVPTDAVSLLDIKIYTGDFNGDGKSDLAYLNPVTGSTTQHNLTIAFSTGTDFKTYSSIIDIGTYSKDNCEINDFNRDGRSDIFIIDNSGKAGSWNINKKDIDNDVLVKSITNGFGQKTSFSYGQPDEGKFFFTPLSDTPLPDGLMAFTPNRVVTTLSQPNGIGGITDFNYSYVGGLLHRQGKGFLGFSTVTQKSLELVTEFVSSYSYHSLTYTPYVSGTTFSKDNITVNTSTYTNNFYSRGSYWYFQYISPSTSFDEIGNVLTTKTVNINFANGDLLNTATNTNNGTSGGITSTSFTYGDYGSPLIVRMPKTQTVTGTVMGGTGTYLHITNFDAYDNNARPTIIVSDKGTSNEMTMTLGYNNFGSIISKTTTYKDKYSSPANQNVTSNMTYTFSSDGRFLTKKANNSFTTQYQYEPTYGYLTSTTAPNNLVTYFNSYDDLYRPLIVTDPMGIVTRNTYNWDINPTTHSIYKVTSATDNLASVTTNYDEFGRVLGNASDEWNGVLNSSKTYDAKGQINESYLPHFTTDIVSNFYQNYTYKSDGTNRLEVFNDRGLTHSYNYSSLNTTYTDPAQRTTTQLFNAMGLPISNTDIAGGTVSYTDYHNSGQAQTIKPIGDDYKMTITYDAFGRKISMTDKSSGTINYDYNPLDQPNYMKDADGHEYNVTYDIYGRTAKKTFTGGSTVSYIYTYNTTGIAKGSLASVKTSDSKSQQITYGYDGFGRQNKITREIEPNGNGKKQTLVTSQVFDDNGNMTQCTYASGLVLTYEYTKGTLTKIKKDGNDLWQLLNENAYGLPIEMKYGSNTYSYFQYSDKYPLQKEQKVVLDGGDIYYYRTLFDSSTNNLTYRTNFDLLSNLKYDIFEYDTDKEKLKEARYKNETIIQEVTYDAANTGNIATKSDAGTYAYKFSSGKPYQLDDISKTAGSELPESSLDLSYSAFNKVSTITQTSTSANFTYDPNEERAAMKSGIYTMIYGDSYEAMVDGNGNIIKEWTYITNQNGLVAVYVNDQGTKDLYYAFNDHLGSVLLLANEDGTVAEQYNFDAWGRRRDPQTLAYLTGTFSGILRRGFTGHEHLDEYGLINMNGRLYDPIVGRMIQADPVIADATNTQTYNGYSYVFNNPLKYTDANGECPVCIAIIIGVVVSASVNVVSQGVASDWTFKNFNWGTFGISVLAGAAGGVAGIGAGTAFTAATSITEGVAFGAIEGGAGGLVGGFIQSGANYNMQTHKFEFNLGSAIEGSINGAIIGAATGGLISGIGAEIRGNDFWDGFNYNDALNKVKIAEGLETNAIFPATRSLAKKLSVKFKKEINVSRGSIEVNGDDKGLGVTFGNGTSPLSLISRRAIRNLKGEGLDVLRHEAAHNKLFQLGYTANTVEGNTYHEFYAHWENMTRPATSTSYNKALQKLLTYPDVDQNLVEELFRLKGLSP